MEEITRGSGNVFADLGLADAKERQTKVKLVLEISRILDALRLKQTDVARLLGVNQPKVSALTNYKLDGFSVERLMGFLVALDRDVDIVIRQKPSSKKKARLSVVSS